MSESRTIWKFPIASEGVTSLAMPRGALPLYLASIRPDADAAAELVLYASVDPSAPLEPRDIIRVDTGVPFPERALRWQVIGPPIISGSHFFGNFVSHLLIAPSLEASDA